MDQSTALELIDNDVQKMKDSMKVLSQYCDAKKNTLELLTHLECITQESLKGTTEENEELDKEILNLEKELSELEIACSHEEKELSVQQRIVGDKEREIQAMYDIRKQYSQRLAKASAVPSKKDLKFYERCEKKLLAYKEITGVMWDFDACSPTSISGYLLDPSNSKMKLFKVNIDGKNTDEISKEMWELLKKQTQA